MFFQALADVMNRAPHDLHQLETGLGIGLESIQFLNGRIEPLGALAHIHFRQPFHPGLDLLGLGRTEGQHLQIMGWQLQA